MHDEPRSAPPGPEEDRLLDHQYDGIQEYDNPMPKWWTTIFWITIGWSVLYVLNVPGIGSGKGRIANYERDMEVARKQYALQSPAAPALSDDALWAMTRVPAQLAAGQTQFQNTCTACHGPDGGGVIGPNLTDAYWIHGDRPTELVRTVTDGVLDKGMPAWGQTLKPDEVSSVVAYILTLRGTHPANPKEPQGVNADSLGRTRGGPSSSIGAPPGSAVSSVHAGPGTTP